MSEGWVRFEDPVEAKGYAQISNAVMRDGSLSMEAKYLYGLLKSFAWQDPNTYPGVKTLCEAAGVSNHTLGKYLKELVAAELVEVKRRGQGKTNLYTFKKLDKRYGQEQHPSSHPEMNTGSHQERNGGSHNENSVNEDAEDNSTEGAQSAKTEAVESLANHTMKAIYAAMKDEQFVITGKDYGQQVARVQWALDNMDPSENELEALPTAYVRAYKIRGPATDAVYALNELRRQGAREQVLNESSAQEQPHPQGPEAQAARDKPRKARWYSACFGVSDEKAQAWIDEGATHSEIMARLEASSEAREPGAA